MECVLCTDTDEHVTTVATCSNRCCVTAHPQCWEMRKVSGAWRKKHHNRGNDDTEVCMVVGCHGKCKAKIISSAERFHDETYVSENTSTLVDVAAVDDPTRPCCFMGRDGLPCRRPAVANNACTRHSRDALIMCKMIERSETMASATKQEETRRVTDSACQTDEEPSYTRVEELLRELEYAEHREALRITRLDIKLDDEREAMERERATLLAKSEEDACTISYLQEELARLRTENVTLKRREESIKAKYMSGGDKREVVRKMQEFLATM